MPTRGGAVYFQSKPYPEIAQSTFSANQAVYGSAIASLDSGSGAVDIGTITNTIFRDGGDEIYIAVDQVRDAMAVTHSNVEGGWPGEGNTDVDPLFASPGYWDSNGTPDDPNDDILIEGDYHLKSQAGRWDAIAETWVVDEVTSPCIDAGDPYSPIGLEPFPSGGRINMGFYGGTAEASRSYFGEPLCETIMAGDIHGDCRVDLADLLIVISNWHEDPIW